MKNKKLKTFIKLTLITSIFIFYPILFLIISFLIAFFTTVVILLVRYLKKFNNYDDAFSKPPWWMPKKLYTKFLIFLKKTEDQKNQETASKEIEEALDILEITDVQNISKEMILKKWKQQQKIYHPDSSINPDVEKSAKLNEAKELLLTLL